MRVDVAHYANVILPPIKLFEVGGVYFVRDGNHRVSVAKTRGAEFIDAEVISLATEIAITPGMSSDDLRRAVIAFERKRFFEATHLDALRPGCALEFTTVGRYEEILGHIREHKWYINLKKAAEIPYEDAVVSWYDTVYSPIVAIIRSSRLSGQVPPRDRKRPVRLRRAALERAQPPLRADLHPGGGGGGLLERSRGRRPHCCAWALRKSAFAGLSCPRCSGRTRSRTAAARAPRDPRAPGRTASPRPGGPR